MLRPVRQLVRLRGGVALGVAERLRHRQLDHVGTGRVVRHVAAVTDHGARRGEELLGALDQLQLLGLGLGLSVVVSRQAFDLRDVEHPRRPSGTGISRSTSLPSASVSFLVKRSAKTTIAPCSPLRTCAWSASACLNVIQSGEV